MTSIVISGSGLYAPPFAVSNEALVAAFNQLWISTTGRTPPPSMQAAAPPALELRVHREGLRHQEPLSGEQRGVLDPDIMQPLMAECPDDQPSIMDGDGGGGRRTGADRRRS